MKNKDRVPGLRVLVVRDAPTAKDHIYAEGAKGAKDLAAIVRGFVPVGDEREHFLAVLLDTRRRVKGVCVVSIGTLSASLVHPREVFRPAIVAGAAAVVLAHNHPSGDPSPSSEDRDVTQRLVSAGQTIGIPVVDHIIVGDDGEFYSFREHGIL
jgi:DNA repair protein RadC